MKCLVLPVFFSQIKRLIYSTTYISNKVRFYISYTPISTAALQTRQKRKQTCFSKQTPGFHPSFSFKRTLSHSATPALWPSVRDGRWSVPCSWWWVSWFVALVFLLENRCHYILPQDERFGTFCVLEVG